MSRIGKLPVAIPGGVTVEEKARKVTVKGPKGALELSLRPEIDVKVEKAQVVVQPNTADTRHVRAYHGMTRAILNNMMKGVTQGYARNLEIIGVGWNAAVQGKKLVLDLKYGPDGEFVIREIKRVSKPGCRVYSGTKKLPRVLRGQGIYVLSTPKGVLSDRAARLENVGGEVLCQVY